MTHEERKQLQADAGDLALSQYIRNRLFQEQGWDLNNCGRLSPQSRQKLLAQILIKLGQSGLAQNLSDLTEAARLGVSELSPELHLTLAELTKELREIRLDLIKALGLRPEKGDSP